MTNHHLLAPSVLVALFGLALGACGGGGGPTPDTGPIVPNEDGGPVIVDAGHDAARSDTGPPVDAGHDAGPPVDSGVVPVFRHPVSTPDAQLAHDALQIMGVINAGATSPYCRDCHTLSRSRLQYWRGLSDQALSSAGCLNDLAVTSDASAHAMVECIRASGSFSTQTIGVFATAAQLPWFQYVFEHGEGASATTAHDAFVTQASMPQVSGGYAPMTQEQFDIVAEWFIRGLPAMDTILGPDPAPTSCTAAISPAVASHTTTMATSGWHAVNAANGMLMYGCAGAATAADCLSTVPLASTTAYGTNWETVSDGVAGAHLRVLYTTNYATAYWTRGSVDGRYVAHGAATAPNLRFIDLQASTVIGGAAMYDPSWFPDGSGFIVQGASGGARVCEQSVLSVGSPTMLRFTEAGCSSGSGIGLYEHVAASVGGHDYWALNTASGTSAATWDDGGHRATLADPEAPWGTGASSTLSHMLNTASGFTVGTQANIAHPFEGDAVISATSTLMLTRMAGAGGVPLAYVLRSLNTSATPPTTTEIARYCFAGAKPELSFDERYFAYHHYIGDGDAVELGFTSPTDPAFAAYRTQGGANTYLVDMVTGHRYRLTNVSPGQYALYPHFRSDGWIYMIVRTLGSTAEHVLASDAALLVH